MLIVQISADNLLEELIVALRTLKPDGLMIAMTTLVVPVPTKIRFSVKSFNKI